MKRVLIIANKTWEVEPLINALLNPEFKPKDLIVPQQLNHPRKYGQVEYIPRATYLYEDMNTSIEIWCIQDLMDSSKHPSSSEEKYKCLPYAFSYKNNKKPDFVIAFGTAGFLMPPNTPTDESNNGCVSIGASVFIHDGHPVGDENIYSRLHVKDQFEKEISTASDAFIDQLIASADFIKNVELRFLKPFLNPAKNIRVIIKKDHLALSNVNVTDYREYETKDGEGIKAVINSGTKYEIGSIETTHGIIRILSESPFLFVSGITDRAGFFSTEVQPKTQSQNYTCAYNAGIVVAWMIPELLKYLP